MALVSMNDILKNVKSYSRGGKEDIVRFYFETQNQKNGVKHYLSFQVGKVIAEQAGWKIRDYVNFIWDSVAKKGILESATQSTGRPLHIYSPRIMQVRFLFVEGYELPEFSQVAGDIKVKKGRVSFTLNEEKE